MHNYKNSKRKNEILFYLLQNPSSLTREITSFIYMHNKNVVEKTKYVVYKCCKCKKIIERKKSIAKVPTCNIMGSNHKRCRGVLEQIEEKKLELDLGKKGGRYEGAVKDRYLNKLESSELIMRGVKGYKLNLKGVFQHLATKNPKFQDFIKYEFHEAAKAQLILSLFRKHVYNGRRLLKMAKKEKSLHNIDISEYWDFFDMFKEFVYFYGRTFFKTKEREKYLTLLRKESKLLPHMKQFMHRCWWVWHFSEAALANTLGIGFYGDSKHPFNETIK